MTTNYRMPTCNRRDTQKIIDVVIDDFRGKTMTTVVDFACDIGPTNLCRVLHAMRRWYSYNTWNAAKKILPFRAQLEDAMDLSAPIGAFRGFKVDKNSPMAALEEGEVISLPVTRNGGCTSWTLERGMADRFSGASKGKTGLVVKLVSERGVEAFIAPPSHSEPWFNKLYENTMGRSFRFNEQEYAIYGKRLTVEVVRVKR